MEHGPERGRIVIVEDEPLIAADLSNQLRKANYQIVDLFDTAEETIDFLQRDQDIDVIIMDIQLQGDMDGIDAAQYIHSNHNIPIIFLTSNTDRSTFQRSKIAFPHAFLSKPFRVNDVIHSIDLAIESRIQTSDENIEFLPDRIFIKTNQSLERIIYDDILYFEADGSYTNLITDDNTYLLSQTLKKCETRLPINQFIKVHRSFVVNIKNVTKMSDVSLFFKEKKIPLSRNRRDALLRLFKTL